LRPVEGEVFTVDIASCSRESPFWLLEGTLGTPRFDAELLRLEPLALLERRSRGEGAPSGEAPSTFELERVVPRIPGFPQSGSAAVAEIVAFYESGDRDLAEMIAGELLARDLRCLEAHALLGRLYSEGPIEQRLERVGDAGSAHDVYERLLQLAPEDPMGVRNGLSTAAG
jgi:hypothetical protein